MMIYCTHTVSVVTSPTPPVQEPLTPVVSQLQSTLDLALPSVPQSAAVLQTPSAGLQTLDTSSNQASASKTTLLFYY